MRDKKLIELTDKKAAGNQSTASKAATTLTTTKFFRLEVEQTLGGVEHCSASLGVNESLAMSGEQRALSAPPVNWSMHQSTLHLGGIPAHTLDTVDLPVTKGIIGCMQALQVNLLPTCT